MESGRPGRSDRASCPITIDSRPRETRARCGRDARSPRIDMRLAKDGTIYVIEANPNPWLSSQAEFAMAARGSERTYTEMIKTIVEVAIARYEEQ